MHNALLFLSVGNLCKQIGPRPGLIWFQTVWHSDKVDF